MIPSPEDPHWMSDPYQSDLRSLRLTLRENGLEFREVGIKAARAGIVPALSGEWRLAVGATIGPILKAPIGFWLQARRGRTVHLSIGEIETDVRTADELVSAIRIAECYRDVTENGP
ncbi:MAG: hypothetical protein ABI158_01940 [Edaphobacter sp.]